MTTNRQDTDTSGVHMTEISHDPHIKTTTASSSVPLSVSSSVEHSTVPTTANNGSAVAMHSTSSAAPLSDTSDSHLQSHGEPFESEEEEDVKVPLDKVRLTFLLISGHRHTEDFDPATPIVQVKKYIMSHWPQGTCLAHRFYTDVP